MEKKRGKTWRVAAVFFEQLSILERPRADTITQHSRWTSTETKAQTGTHKHNPKRTFPSVATVWYRMYLAMFLFSFWKCFFLVVVSLGRGVYYSQPQQRTSSTTSRVVARLCARSGSCGQAVDSLV